MTKSCGPTIGLRVSMLAVVVAVAMLSACSARSAEPGSQTSPSPSVRGDASAELTVDGHKHTISGSIDCTIKSENPNATPPQGETDIDARDDSAQLSMSWLSDATPPLVGLSFTLQVEDGEFSLPYFPNPRVEATSQGKNYTVSGELPVRAPGQPTPGKLPVEIRVTCP